MTRGNEVRVLRAAERAATVWKNGGGITREIAAWPEGAGMDDFAWRVSVADVAADGPFSAFPGVDRVLTLAEGAGMDLTVAGVHRLVDERYVPQRFAGDEPTDCRLLAGPVVNFNVMYRRDVTDTQTAVVRGDLALGAEPGETLLVVALHGTVVLEGTGGGQGPAVELAAYDAALASGRLACRVRAQGRAAVVRFRPHRSYHGRA